MRLRAMGSVALLAAMITGCQPASAVAHLPEPVRLQLEWPPEAGPDARGVQLHLVRLDDGATLWDRRLSPQAARMPVVLPTLPVAAYEVRARSTRAMGVLQLRDTTQREPVVTLSLVTTGLNVQDGHIVDTTAPERFD